MANEFVVRVWRPGSRAPSENGITITTSVALDRELLGVLDGTISRTANAPKLTPLSPSILELQVPERSARPVLVIEGLRFEGLQQALPTASEAWTLAPAQFGRPERIALGDAVSVALVRQIDWYRPGPTHYLVTLPGAREVQPGESARVIAPALLVIGEAAADVTAIETAVPAATQQNSQARAFRLAEVEALLEPNARLEAFPNAPDVGRLRVPGARESVTASELPRVAHEWLERGLRQHVFFPVLEDERLPRLALAYRRGDGTVGTIVSGAQPERLIDELVAFLKGSGDRATTSVRMPRAEDTDVEPVTESVPPLLREAVARFGSIETRNERFGRVLSEVTHAAETELSLLLLGESGTGKEHLAQAVHEASPRRNGPFVGINCSAVSDALIESELFGHRRGAFTGAQSERAGAFLSADGGTLLLDEIGDAPARVQFALLRTLESRRVKAVGADTERPVDVRVIAATSRDLHALMEQGTFRRDLYYRLAQMTVIIPPLRERREDVAELAVQLLEREQPGVTLSHQALALLERHDWPGNVRELRNALMRAVALSRGAKILQTVHFSQFAEAAERAAPVAQDSTTVRPSPSPSSSRELVFPPHVVAHAERIWRDGGLTGAGSVGATRQDHRAAQRAALLCLAVQRPFTTWPKALSGQWFRLFGDKWATSEEGRGVREMLRELGLDSRDDGVRGCVVGLVSRVPSGERR